jgi:hypothetical protein
MDQTTPPKRQHGCLFYGCISGAVCLVLLLLGFLVLFQLVRKAVNQYTDTAPMKLPVVQLSQPEIEEVQRRFNNFSDAASAGRPTAPLELTSDEVNALIQNNPDFQGARDKLYLSIAGTNLHAQVSLPMSQLGLTLFKGRYLNGTATLAVSLRSGVLQLTPLQITVKSKPLPGVYMDKIRHENLATSINNNSRASVALNHLQSIEVTDGKLILVAKKEK